MGIYRSRVTKVMTSIFYRSEAIEPFANRLVSVVGQRRHWGNET
jgi:hypothetical protein